MLDGTLTVEQRNSIIRPLFGFEYYNELWQEPEKDPFYILLDDEGNEFYGNDANTNHDFTTLRGIIKYATEKAKEDGYFNCQWDIKKVLGIKG